MVSLERENSATRGSGHGGYFFDHESQGTEDDEHHLVQSEVNTTESVETRYRKMWTIPLAIGQILLLVVFWLMSFLVPIVILPSCAEYKHTFDEREKKNLFIMVCLQASVWLLVTIITCVYHFFHIRHQRLGYLEFYRDTRVYKEVPGFVFSVGNAVMLILPTLAYTHNLFDPDRKSALWPSNYFQIVFTIQAIASIPCLIKYILLIHRFNRDRLPPDIDVEEHFHMVSSPCTNFPQIGFKEATYLDNLLERQADMILYLKRHAEDLSKKILHISNSQHRGQQMNKLP